MAKDPQGGRRLVPQGRRRRPSAGAGQHRPALEQRRARRATASYAHAVEWYDIGLERGDAWSGANAAWIIANRGVPGLGLRDAAIRAAKAAALRNRRGRRRGARTLLAGLPPEAVDGAAQELVNALGGQLAVDGSFGPASVAEMQRVLAAAGAPRRRPTQPADRLHALAGAYWTQQKFRVDLY